MKWLTVLLLQLLQQVFNGVFMWVEIKDNNSNISKVPYDMWISHYEKMGFELITNISKNEPLNKPITHEAIENEQSIKPTVGRPRKVL